MALAMVALLGGLWGGLSRLGWNWTGIYPDLAPAHGPLMVSGFIGTLIAVERAVAAKRWWAYAAPVSTGLGALAVVAGLPGAAAGGVLMTTGSLIVVAVLAVGLSRRAGLPEQLMVLGAGAWLAGNGLWLLGWPIFTATPWWAAFLVLTIAAERLELTRFLPTRRASHLAFVAAIGLLSAGLIVSVVATDLGSRLAGLGMLSLAAWLVPHDMARRAMRTPGMTRFVAVSLLSGYVWLGVAGALALRFGALAAGPVYDAWLHAIFLGFVFSMIFGHAPIIFPAVLGVAVPYRAAFYGHLVLLHASLVLRVGGDLAPWWPGRLWGGLLNALAVLLFLANTGRSVWLGRDSPGDDAVRGGDVTVAEGRQDGTTVADERVAGRPR
jgi:hypothetical protein